jgi:hypothetical protein
MVDDNDGGFGGEVEPSGDENKMGQTGIPPLWRHTESAESKSDGGKEGCLEMETMTSKFPWIQTLTRQMIDCMNVAPVLLSSPHMPVKTHPLPFSAHRLHLKLPMLCITGSRDLNLHPISKVLQQRLEEHSESMPPPLFPRSKKLSKVPSVNTSAFPNIKNTMSTSRIRTRKTIFIDFLALQLCFS